MKKNQSSILIVGHDEHLLATRQWVLQTRGYQVLTIQQPEAVQQVPLSAPLRLVVLCHTLTDEEKQSAASIAADRWPGVKLLTLAGDNGRRPTGLLGQLLHTMDGPEKLLSMVNNLVGSSADVQSAQHP